MPSHNKTKPEIKNIIKILRQKTNRFTEPIVSEFANKWGEPFYVLISCILSLRTKDQTTRNASYKLFKLADNPRDMSKLPTVRIEKTIFPVGFYRVKARTIKGICKRLINDFSGKVPSTMDELLSLKGVGRKTANLVLTEGFGKPGICVDVHVHRISNRLGFVKTKDPYETEMELRKKLPKQYWIEYNKLLVIWGQNICRPISPLCSACSINKFCAKVGVKKHR